MKKIINYLCLLFGATFLFASCQKEPASIKPVVVDGEVLITVNATEGVNTRTYIDGTAVKWANSGETLKVFEVKSPNEGDAVVSVRNSAEGETTDSGATMSFGVTMPEAGAGTFNFDYYAFYPSSAYQANSGVTSVTINTPSTQTPTATSFDPAADLLIAKHVDNGASQATELNMQFARAVSIGVMTIKNLESTDPVTRISFSAKEDVTPVKLAGRTAFNLTDGSLVNTYGGNVGETTIVLDVEALNATANTSVGMTTFFSCYPFAINSSNPGSFKVVVETATETFTKEVNVSSAKGLALNVGKASTFSVDMDGIVGEVKAVDLCYAYLDFADYEAAGGSNSYGNVTIDKPHGDSWASYACKSGGAIGIRNTASTNDSYIKLPDFADDIETVVVTLQSATSGKILFLESTAIGTTGDIASATTTEALKYTFDLSGGSYKTAYLRATGFQALVSKIEVYAGSDTRVALDTPANVSASLNATDPAVTNSIDVSWDVVAGAGSYLISLMDENTDITTKTAVSSPYTVTGLAYNMEYVIAVKAIPADPYVNKESSEADAPSNVTTGAEPVGGAYYEKITDVASVTDGEYIIAAYANSKYYAMSNTFATQISGVEIDVVNNKISETDGENYVVTIAVNGSGEISISNGSQYLNCTASGTSFSVSGTASYHSIETASYGTFQIKHLTASRAVVYRTSTYNRFGNYSSTGPNGTEYYNVELFKKVDNRNEAGMSWSAASATATYNTGNNLSFTPLTLTPGNATGISYASTDETIATINASTGEITITALSDNTVKEGSTTIRAIFAGNQDYKPQTATYTLSVVDSRAAATTPTFSPAAGEVEVDQVVTFNPTDQGLTFHYTMDGSNPTVSSPTAASVTIDAAKTVKVLATKTGYKPSAVAEAAYTIQGVQANDGSLEHPYTPEEARTLALGGDEGSYYISGIVAKIQNQFSAGYGTANFWLSVDGVAQDVFEGYKIKYLGNVNWVNGCKTIEVGDEVVIYGTLTIFNSTVAETSSGYLVSWNGTTKGLIPGSLSTSKDDANKQITVTWGAATGTTSAITYVVNCGTQSYNANAAGSHTFTMTDYGTYSVSVVASATDAFSATATTSDVTLSSNPSIPDPESIVFGNLGLTNQQQYSDPFDGGNFTITFGGGGNDGKYYTTGSGIRTYGGGTITIESSHNISQVQFTWDGSYAPTADVASPSGYNTSTKKWTGEAKSIVLTRPSGSGHWRLQSVTVTYAD